jgi:hypothetical protein
MVLGVNLVAATNGYSQVLGLAVFVHAGVGQDECSGCVQSNCVLVCHTCGTALPESSAAINAATPAIVVGGFVWLVSALHRGFCNACQRAESYESVFAAPAAAGLPGPASCLACNMSTSAEHLHVGAIFGLICNLSDI